jgi:DNA anti-recombination protein RmuC
MRRRFLSFALLLSLALLGAPAYAGDPKDAQEAAVLESRRQQIHELVMIRLNNALDLSPAQSQQISQTLTKFRKEKSGYRHRIRVDTLKLREISNSGNDAQIQGLIQQISATRAQLDKIDDRMFAEAKKHLNTKQQAQFIFVMDEIRKEVQAVKRGAPPPGGGAMMNTLQGGGNAAPSAPAAAPTNY